MIRLNTTPDDVEHRLQHHQLACPGCGHQLAPWGHDRPRPIRHSLVTRHATTTVRRRRVRCTGCHATHIIQDHRLSDRRRDTARVIREALTLRRRHHWGYRRVADWLDRPHSTVRNWYRTHQANPRWPSTGSIT